MTRTSGRLAVWLAVGAVVTACGDSSGPDPQPPISVEVGNDFFTSVRNGSSNPAVDTVAVNGMVTWTWTELGTHDIVPTGSPSFPGSEDMLEPGSTYSVTFTAPGTYTYECSVHGAPMVGRVVVPETIALTKTYRMGEVEVHTPTPGRPVGDNRREGFGVEAGFPRGSALGSRA